MAASAKGVLRQFFRLVFYSFTYLCTRFQRIIFRDAIGNVMSDTSFNLRAPKAVEAVQAATKLHHLRINRLALK